MVFPKTTSIDRRASLTSYDNVVRSGLFLRAISRARLTESTQDKSATFCRSVDKYVLSVENLLIPSSFFIDSKSPLTPTPVRADICITPFLAFVFLRKSTLLNIIGMLDNYDSGSYKLDNVPIKDLDETKAAKYRNKFLGFVFQSFNLINYKTALENIALPLYYQGISRNERQKVAIEYLKKVGLADWAEHLPSELSGGQKQRIAIARALASQPKVLLADEPTGALDSTTSEEVMDLIKQINNEGKTILVVTHEQDIANMCKRIITLKDGIIMTDMKTK